MPELVVLTTAALAHDGPDGGPLACGDSQTEHWPQHVTGRRVRGPRCMPGLVVLTTPALAREGPAGGPLACRDSQRLTGLRGATARGVCRGSWFNDLGPQRLKGVAAQRRVLHAGTQCSQGTLGVATLFPPGPAPRLGPGTPPAPMAAAAPLGPCVGLFTRGRPPAHALCVT